MVEGKDDHHAVVRSSGVILRTALIVQTVIGAPGRIRGVQIKNGIGVDTGILPPTVDVLLVKPERVRTLEVGRDVFRSQAIGRSGLKRTAGAADPDVEPASPGGVAALNERVRWICHLVPIEVIAFRQVARDTGVNRDADRGVPGFLADGPQADRILQPAGDVVVVHPLLGVVQFYP